MDLKDVRTIRVPRKNRNRIGRGPGSGWGVTAGRGYNGQGKRTGTRRRLRFEGGQMPLYRRLPKKGFANHAFKLRYHVVNVGELEAVFASGATVDLAAIQGLGLAPKKAKYLKLLGFGSLTRALSVRCHAVSGGAKEKIEAAQGTLAIVPVRAVHREKGEKAGTARAGGAQAGGTREADTPAGGTKTSGSKSAGTKPGGTKSGGSKSPDSGSPDSGSPDSKSGGTKSGGSKPGGGKAGEPPASGRPGADA